MSNRREFLKRVAVSSTLAATGIDVTNAIVKETRANPPATMKFVQIPQTDLFVSRLAFGAALYEVPEKERVRLINAVYDNGINFLDDADFYNEAPLGNVLKQSPGIRHKLVIQTKCGIVVDGGQFSLDCSREHIIAAAENSLRQLHTDYVDILLLHWPDALVEPEEVASAFEELKRSGKVRYFGVSNHSQSQIELLKRYVRQPIVTNQIYLALENSYLLTGGVGFLTDLFQANRVAHNYDYVSAASAANTLEYCQLNRIQVQAWSPLTGKLLNPPTNATPEVKHAVNVLRDMANKKNASPFAVALAWLLRHPVGIVPVMRVSKIEHLIENCMASEISLTRKEWYALLVATSNMHWRKIL